MTISAPRAKTKKPNRRMGVENSETRAQLIKLAARLMRDEGCSAITARRLAEDLGLKRQIVHYYFGTIEDLLIAVVRRSVIKLHERVKQEFESGANPLQVIQELSNLSPSTVFEFSALAMRSEAIRAEIKRYTDEFRNIQAEAIARYLEARGIESSIPPKAVAFIVNAVSHALAIERALGANEGHVETQALLDEWMPAYAQGRDWSLIPESSQAKSTPAIVRLVASQQK